MKKLFLFIVYIVLMEAKSVVSETTLQETLPTEAPLTEAPLTETPSTDTPLTETNLPETLPTEAPLTETLSTDIALTEIPLPEIPVPETFPSEVPSTETPLPETFPTETHSTEALPTEIELREPPTTVTPSTNLPPESTLPWKEFNLLTEFQQCDGLYLQLLTAKLYANSPFKPFRDTSLYYLTNIWEGLSCMESTSFFSLNENSVVNSAIYFDFVHQGAWLSVSTFDKYTGVDEVIFELDTNSSNWRLLNRKISGKYENAGIMIMTNMNFRSRLAIEYLNISNV